MRDRRMRCDMIARGSSRVMPMAPKLCIAWSRISCAISVEKTLIMEALEAGVNGAGEGGGEKDPLYDQAVEIVLRTRRPSISLVQRHLRIGYNRAARLIEDMERAGLVSPMQSNGNREVLVPAKVE